MNEFVSNLFSVEGKVAAITGGGGYLCGEMARSLACAGAAVAVLDLRMEKAEAVAEEINLSGGRAIAVAADATKKEDHISTLDHIINNFGDVDILINGAGINSPTAYLDIPLDEWRAVIDSHVTSTFLACQVYGQYMVNKKKGSIINMSSASAGPPLSKAFAYSVAKAGIKNLTQNLAREWAPYNVRVNALRPGFFPTQWSRKNFITPEREKTILSHTPMGRYGKPEELIGAVVWLNSQAAGFVTGTEIIVDGGFTCMTI